MVNDLKILKNSLEIFQRRINQQMLHTDKMRNINEILNYLLKEIEVLQSKKKLLEIKYMNLPNSTENELPQNIKYNNNSFPHIKRPYILSFLY